jgi:DNA mismatch repair protein MSH2
MWRSGGSSELETCYVKNANFEVFLKDLLLVRQYRVEIWRKNNKTNEWSMCNHVRRINMIYNQKTVIDNFNPVFALKGSPGNLSQFEDVLYSGEDDQTRNPICDPGLISIQITNDDNINVFN